MVHTKHTNTCCHIPYLGQKVNLSCQTTLAPVGLVVWGAVGLGTRLGLVNLRLIQPLLEVVNIKEY